MYAELKVKLYVWTPITEPGDIGKIVVFPSLEIRARISDFRDKFRVSSKTFQVSSRFNDF